MSTANGPAFWDSLLGPTKGQYPEYVSPDIFLGEYVALLEQDSSESNGQASAAGRLTPILVLLGHSNI